MSGKRIVVADDEEHLGLLVKYKLEHAGFEVEWAMDGKQALGAVRAAPPDLVILDVMMPEMTGYEVLQALKADEALRAIPVIMLTAKGQESDIRQGKELGAAEFVVKPFRPSELLAKVNGLLGLTGNEDGP